MAAGSNWLDSLNGRSSPPSEYDSTANNVPAGDTYPELELAIHCSEGTTGTGSLSPQPNSALRGVSPITPAINWPQHTSTQESATPITLASGQKRQASALQFVDVHAFAKKLKPNDKAELAKFVAVSPTERTVMQHALLLQIVAAGPGGGSGSHTVWEVPKKAKKNLDKYAMRILLSTNLTRYKGSSPTKVLMGMVKTKNHWGLPTNVESQEDKWEKLLACARDCLTQRQSAIKYMVCPIIESLDSKTTQRDIVTLCTKLVNYGHFKTDIIVTPQLCARIAYLRASLKNLPRSSDYWKTVDDGLQKLHDKAKEVNDPSIITKRFVTILKDDRTLYGSGKDIQKAIPSTSQKEIEDANNSGTFTNVPVGTDDNGDDG
ncbi:hypothetical protein PAXRUDRAFT_775181 [Paxillus rubicundulus Ve08.2h10]|uniref:Uncharacterized protein n=1 Tax=Paxillus rubicundulus Ve08.2h10 TaxID=930991 RepID=A0A0D0DIS1_9AGAM|nr:hypothetical protein PAXRUDRAFT_775181 [Paxillus rubicundulus Ve08.2h10]